MRTVEARGVSTCSTLDDDGALSARIHEGTTLMIAAADIGAWMALMAAMATGAFYVRALW